MRNGIYVIFNGYDLPVNTIRDNDEEILIRYEGTNCPFPDFSKSKHEEDVYFLAKKISELTEAYYVRTFGLYKGHAVEVFSKGKGSDSYGLVTIGTKNINAIHELALFGDENWGFTDINTNALEKIWEERTPVFNLVLPVGVNPIQEIE